MVKDVFRVHWYWKRFNPVQDAEGAKVQKELEALLEQRKLARKTVKFLDLGSPRPSKELPKLEAIVDGNGSTNSQTLGTRSRQSSGKLD